MFRFFLILTKEGRTRFSQYYVDTEREERVLIEAELARKCLQQRADQQRRGALILQKLSEIAGKALLGFAKLNIEHTCTFMEYRDFKIVFRRYASLYFVAGIDLEENELGISEFIQNIVEILNSYFKNVCEIDIMLHLDKVHMILDEMIIDGEIVESCKKNVLAMMRVIDGKTK